MLLAAGGWGVTWRWVLVPDSIPKQSYIYQFFFMDVGNRKIKKDKTMDDILMNILNDDTQNYKKWLKHLDVQLNEPTYHISIITFLIC